MAGVFFTASFQDDDRPSLQQQEEAAADHLQASSQYQQELNWIYSHQTPSDHFSTGLMRLSDH